MHLIQALAAGVAGCESGTFDIVLRGTSTPASYYTDFEGLTSPIVGTGVSLDSRGGGIFYVNALVKVTCKSSAGATIREFIAGGAATCEEIRSSSITGTHYQSGAVAAGNPTTVKAWADMWFASAGAVDFKVLYNSVATNLSTVVGALSGRRTFVVTEYGAVGDGVANDLSAVNAAISAADAAGGGIVYFPPGTYALSTSLTTFSTVALDGAGVGLTTIKMTANALFVNAGATFPSRISGIAFTFSSASLNGWLQFNAGAQECLVEDCDFQPTTSAGVSSFGVYCTNMQRFSRCVLRKGAAGVVVNIGNNAVVANVRMSECRFVLTGALTSYCILVGGAAVASRLDCIGCVFDASAVTSGTGRFVGIADAASGMVSESNIIPPQTSVTSWAAFETWGELVESNNRLQTTLDSVSNTYKAYTISSAVGRASKLFSRELLTATGLNPNTATITVHPSQAGMVKVVTTVGTGGTQAIAAYNEECTDGARCVISVHNDTAGAITYQWSTRFSSAATFNVAANSIRHFLCVFVAARSLWFLVSDVAGAELAE